MAKILAVVEEREGALRRVSLEVVTAARSVAAELGAEVDALLLSAGPVDATALGAHGADRVLVGEDASLAGPSASLRAAVVAQVARQNGYHTILLAATTAGKDLAPRVAARLDVPLATDATALAVEDGEILVTRPMYGGKAFAKLVLAGEPRLVSMRPNVFTPREQQAAGAVERIDVAAAGAEAGAAGVAVREFRAAEGESVDVGEAPIVVSGGRGMQGPENWRVLEELRAALGERAALGASRAVVDAGWRPHAEQVGQTGKTVSPQLYFAIGISGAIQHLAGMRTARTIVAVNKDAEAPIFGVADYGIVGDALEVVPRLTEEIRKLAR